MSRHPPRAIAVDVQTLEATCTLVVSWEFDTFFADNETPEAYHIGIGTDPLRLVAGTLLECRIDGVPRGAQPVTLDVQVCAHWDVGVGGVAENACALADPIVIPPLPSAPPVPVAAPDAPRIDRFLVHPRTWRRDALIEVGWSTDASRSQYQYDSGRDDLVDEQTEDRALVFTAATAVTFRFRVRALNLDFSTTHQRSDWAEASAFVPRPHSVRAFLDGTDASAGLGRLWRSQGFDPVSVRRVMG